DNLFVLVQNTDETKKESKQLLEKSPLWQTLPAVKKGNVHVIPAEWNTDDLLAIDKIYDNLPKWMDK
ncbi:MAG: ABC transporter, partial [Kurthia sp.]